jgi:hypothetical protein
MKIWDVVITIAVILAYFLLSPKKKQVGKNPPPFLNTDQEAEDFEHTVIPQVKEHYETINRENISQENECFTYETADSSNEVSYETLTPKHEMKTEQISQDIQNEDEKSFILTFEEDELYKGIIFSEILKRPYN